MVKATHLSDDELSRYSRQLLLPEFDIAGQLALKQANVVVIGLGGLGSAVALYLGASGVGRLILADNDIVELSNLQRQIIHSTDCIGQAKVESAKQTLAAINPDIHVQTIAERLDQPRLEALITSASLVIDCSDNFATRVATNRACLAHGIPLISGAAIRLEGQIAVFDFRRTDAPCYECLYSAIDQNDDEDAQLNCSENGVLAPLVGVIGSLQAMEAIKVLSGVGESLGGYPDGPSYLMTFDGAGHQWQRFQIARDPECPACGSGGCP